MKLLQDAGTFFLSGYELLQQYIPTFHQQSTTAGVMLSVFSFAFPPLMERSKRQAGEVNPKAWGGVLSVVLKQAVHGSETVPGAKAGKTSIPK